MNKHELKLIYSEAEIRAQVKRVAEEIMREYNDDKPIVCICVLRGAVVFFADLMKEMKDPRIMLDFISLSSYSGDKSTGNIKLKSEPGYSLEGKHVLVVEDIIDSGRTVNFLREYFAQTGAIDVKVACLLDKPMTRVVDAYSNYTVFTLQRDAFVVGYGLDYEQIYRNLDGIYEVHFV